MSKTSYDYHRLATLSGGGSLALPQHALSPGASESSIESQVAKSLTYWTALQSADAEANSSAIVTDAIAWLTAYRAYIKNPAGGVAPQPR